MTLPRKDILAAIDNATASPGRSELSRWMRRHYDALRDRLDHDRPDWVALAKVFEEAGLTDRTGKPASADAVRKAWDRTRRAVVEARTKRNTSAQPDLHPTPAVRPPPPSGVEWAKPDDQQRIRFKPVALKGSSR